MLAQEPVQRVTLTADQTDLVAELSEDNNTLEGRPGTALRDFDFSIQDIEVRTQDDQRGHAGPSQPVVGELLQVLYTVAFRNRADRRALESHVGPTARRGRTETKATTHTRAAAPAALRPQVTPKCTRVQGGCGSAWGPRR